MLFNQIVTVLFGIALLNIIYVSFFERETLVFALKNLYRNLRRTILTLIAIACATVAIILVETYIENNYWGLRETTIRSELGHIQIQVPGFETKGRSQPTKYLINNHEEIIALINQDPELQQLIRKTTTEIRFSGILMGEGNNSINFIGRGVDPDKEVFFSSQDFYIAGKELSIRSPNQIVIGDGIAKFLDVTPESYVTLLATTSSGNIDVLDAEVRGVFQPLSKELSQVIVKTPIAFAQKLIGVEGVNKIMILLHNTEDTSVAAEKIKTILTQEKFDLIVYEWEELAEFYSSVKNLYDNFFVFFKVIISVVIFFLIMNTMTMSIFERFKEIGTLRAIGFTRRRVINLLTSEAFFLGVISSIVGIVLGLLLCNFITGLDIMQPPPPGLNTPVPLSFYFMGNYNMLMNTVVMLIVISWLGSFAPTFRALKNKIVDCLRQQN